jgi:hypothetical protein
MLAIIVLGMGIDYALFTIRAFQRYGRETDPALILFRTTVFLAAGSTLVGFGALMGAEHAVFQSAGVTSFCGILFSALGTFILLPPLLRRLYRAPEFKSASPTISPEAAGARARRRLRHLELRPRLSAWHKLRRGGLMERIPIHPPVAGPVAVYPAGWGVEAAWLAELAPGVRILGADPDAEKVRVAARVGGSAGEMRQGGIEVLADGGRQAEVALFILTGRPTGDEDPAALLTTAGEALAPGGRLVVLATTAPGVQARQRGWPRWTRPGARPFEVEAAEALLRRMGYGRIAHHGLGQGDSRVWLSAVQG